MPTVSWNIDIRYSKTETVRVKIAREETASGRRNPVTEGRPVSIRTVCILSLSPRCVVVNAVNGIR